MAAFSSQGPNRVNPEILKVILEFYFFLFFKILVNPIALSIIVPGMQPDITAPGVSIIAAYTEATSPTGLSFDKRRVSFNSESGTSMSCPHISGIAGLLKALHPEWSPSAIKSAIITTGSTLDLLMTC